MRKTKNIQECAKFYESLLKKEFIVTLENGMAFSFYFRRENFYHLLGLHKLTDIQQLQNPNRALIYKEIKNGKLSYLTIQNSKFYNRISERINYFDHISALLNKEHSKIIVEFDPDIVSNTHLKNTRFIFYKHETTGYSLLTIGKIKYFYPETFMYENSKRYLTGQKFLNVINIEIKQK